MRIGYIASKYPAVSHTFIQREIAALRARGVEIETFSVWAAKDADLLAEGDRSERDRTYSLLPPRPPDVAAAHARALLTHPLAYARTLAAAWRLSAPGLRGRTLGALRFVEAIVLWAQCRARGVRHVHAHINGTAPFVALLATRFGNSGRASGAWSWSFTVHGPSEFYDVWRERLDAKIESAAFVVCISDFARSQALTFVSEDQWSKVIVVHCGVDTDVFQPLPRDAGNGPVEILSVGRLMPFKGQAVLLEAVAELTRAGRDVHATVIGAGPSRERLELRARELGLERKVTFAGAVGQDEIRRYYERADVFCLSSFAEGVPVVLMEAMAMELPVVAPRIMGIPELVEDGVSGLLVPPGRPDRLADAVGSLIDSTERRMLLGKAGRRKVQGEFDLRRSAELLHAAFSACVEDGRSAVTKTDDRLLSTSVVSS
jgi:colanic acid/amylovoran biosynthesis glycosyltransferase